MEIINSKHSPSPENIVVLDNGDRLNKIDDALRILENNNAINGVVLLEAKRDNIASVVDDLDFLAQRKRIRCEQSYADQLNLKDFFSRFSNYIDARSHSLPIPLNDNFKQNDLVRNITDFWRDSASPLMTINKLNVVNSIIAYVPEYTTSREDSSYINTHVDHSKTDFDYRIVECAEGSGTVLFSDKDFKLFEQERHGRKFPGLELISSSVNCWEVMTGSIIVMRSASKDTTKRACVHAHGIGGMDGPEKRLTIRHDICIP